MPRTKEQNKAIRDQKRKQIMDAALVLFVEKGYHNTSISDITTAANTSKGLLYNYFKSKEQLLEHLVLSVFTDVSEMIDTNKNGIIEHEGMVSYIHWIFEEVQRNHLHWKLYYTLLMQPAVQQIIFAKLMELIQPFIVMMTAYFKNAGYKDPENEMYFFDAMVDGVLMKYILMPDSYPLEAMKQRIIEYYILKVELL